MVIFTRWGEDHRPLAREHSTDSAWSGKTAEVQVPHPKDAKVLGPGRQVPHAGPEIPEAIQ